MDRTGGVDGSESEVKSKGGVEAKSMSMLPRGAFLFDCVYHTTTTTTTNVYMVHNHNGRDSY